MNKCNSCNIAKGNIICKVCSKHFCEKCNKQHLMIQSMHTTQTFYLCEECDEKIAAVSCVNCEELLCLECDQSIHNKAKRTSHQRCQCPIFKSQDVTNFYGFKDFQSQLLVFYIFEQILNEIEENVLNDQILSYLKTLNNSEQITVRLIFIYQALEKCTKAFQNLVEMMKKKGYSNDNLFIELLGYNKKDEALDQMLPIISRIAFIGSYENNKEFTSILQKVQTCERSKQINAQLLIEQNGNYEFSALNSQSFTKLPQKQALSQSAATNDSSTDYYQRSNQNEIQTIATISKTKSHHYTSFPNCQQEYYDNYNTQSDENYYYQQNEHQNKHPGNYYKQKNQNYEKYGKKKFLFYNLPYYQRFKVISIEKSLKISFLIQKLLYNQMENGQLSLNKTEFHSLLSNYLHQNRKIYKNELLLNINTVLDIAEAKGIIKLNYKNFDMNAQLIQPSEIIDNDQFVISLSLEQITYQCIVWALISIRNDFMTPSEKLLQSRIKQYFGLKLNSKIWENIFSCLKKQKIYYNDEIDSSLNEELQELEIQTLERFKFQKLIIKKIKDPLVKNEINVIYFQNSEWIAHDSLTVNKETDPQWQLFGKFLKNYYEESTSQLTKSIAGGRYGCAQFIKNNGPLELKQCSLGKLNLYVQEAINTGLLRYQKTLLIWNNFQSDDKSSPTQIQQDQQPNFDETQFMGNYQNNKEQRLRILQDAVIEILFQYQFGLSLAQIPQQLKKVINFPFSLQDFGFLKLKDFLMTLKDKITIEMANTNNSYAILNPNFLNEYKLQKERSETLLNQQNLTDNLSDNQQDLQQQYNYPPGYLPQKNAPAANQYYLQYQKNPFDQNCQQQIVDQFGNYVDNQYDEKGQFDYFEQFKSQPQSQLIQDNLYNNLEYALFNNQDQNFNQYYDSFSQTYLNQDKSKSEKIIEHAKQICDRIIVSNNPQELHNAVQDFRQQQNKYFNFETNDSSQPNFIENFQQELTEFKPKFSDSTKEITVKKQELLGKFQDYLENIKVYSELIDDNKCQKKEFEETKLKEADSTGWANIDWKYTSMNQEDQTQNLNE